MSKILNLPTYARPRIIIKTPSGDVYEFYARAINSTTILGEIQASYYIVVDENAEVLKNGEEVPEEKSNS